MTTIAPDLSVFHDYTGASLFTVFFYMLFFYILDAYSVGAGRFQGNLGPGAGGLRAGHHLLGHGFLFL